jgi:hypothetical protein
MAKIVAAHNITRRRPNRLLSQPLIGVAITVARKFDVMIQVISSRVAVKAPCNCGKATLATVTVST